MSLIIDSTPKGSAILAYGAARGPGWNYKLLAVVAGSLVLMMITIFCLWFFNTSLSIPKHRLVTIAVRPLDVSQRIDSTLQHDLPPPWRAAIETHSRFPALLGIALDEQRRPHAFAVVMRTTVIASEPGLQIQRGGTLLVLTDGSDAKQETTKLHQVAESIWRLKDADAAFVLRTDLLSAITSDDAPISEGAKDEVRGTWSGSIGRLDFASEQVDGDPLSAPVFATLGGSAETASPVIAGLLSQGVDLRSVSSPPTALALDPKNGGSLFLLWGNDLTPSDAAQLAAIQGSGEHALYPLPDGSESMEYLPAKQSGANIGSTSIFMGEHLASSTFLAPSAPNTTLPEICRGTPRFSLEEDALQAILASWSMPESWSRHVKHFRIVDGEKGVMMCAHFE